MEALTDGEADTQTFGGYNIIPSPLFCGGGTLTRVAVVVFFFFFFFFSFFFFFFFFFFFCVCMCVFCTLSHGALHL